MTSTKKGEYKTTLEYQGERGLMRAIDGVHYRTLGARYIVEQTMQEVERHFVLALTDEKLARAEQHAFDAKSGRVSYVAFVPEIASVQNRVPALYLVPGEKWNAWPSYPHRELQRLATAHALVLIVLEEAEPLAEIVSDVKAHLPVSDRHDLIEGIDAEALDEQIPARAEQLRAPVTQR
jgi:hypothetical protein